MLSRYTQVLVDVVLERKDSIKEIDFSEIDFEKLLVFASWNRVLLLFAENLLKIRPKLTDKQEAILKDIKKEGQKNLLALKKTLVFLDKVFKQEKIDYLIVKTYKFLDYVTFDVDFLIRYRDFNKAQRVLEKNGVEVKSHPGKKTQGLHQKNCFKKGFLKMDLHRKFFWLGIHHIDLDFVWDNATKKRIAGVTCPTPSLEADFLLHNKQLAYERRYITLLDFLAIKYACDQGLDWNEIKNQVAKYRWQETFTLLLSNLNFIHREIFGEEMIRIKTIISRKRLILPLHFSLKEVLVIFKEIAVRQKKVPFFGLSYYFFTTARYLIRKRLPFYDHWYNFNKFSKRKYWLGKCIN